jgi:pSer/pThr/pTyr-binding forkhead associated (FHA) protein
MDINLVLLKKNGSNKIFSLPSNVTIIGRRHTCDLCIPLESVSRRHCQLSCDNGLLKIQDLDSRNGTYLNGKRVKEAVIKAGDSIGIGPLSFVLQIDGQPQATAEAASSAQGASGQGVDSTPSASSGRAGSPQVEVEDSSFAKATEDKSSLASDVAEAMADEQDTEDKIADEQLDDLAGLGDLDSLDETGSA